MTFSPVVLGIDFGGTKIAMAVCDLTGRRLASRTVSAAADAQAAFARGVGSARELLIEAAAGRKLAAVGVSTFGIPAEDGVELAPSIDGWRDIAMGRELRAAFGESGTRIVMATDVKAAALAEARSGALAGADPGIYLNLGTGLAAAIVTGGRVLAGANGAAGEIGYNLRAISDVGVPLDGRVPLEDAVSGLALRRQASATGATMAAGNAAGSAISDEFIAELAFHLVNLAISINPARIAVGGGMTRSWDRIRPGLHAALNAAVPFPPELVLADFPFDAPLMGALALAIDAVKGDRSHNQ